jgi:hypothetical protein
MNINDDHNNEYYKEKYLFIKEKCNDLKADLEHTNNDLQYGGDIDEKKVIKKLNAIKKVLKEKGHSYWFDENGNLLMVGNTQVESKKKLLLKISKNPEKYIGTNLAHVYITTLSDNLDENHKQGLIEFDINVSTIKKAGKNIVFNLRNDKNSLLRFYYRSDTIDKFNRSHARILAQKLLNNEIAKVNPFKFYHYDDFEEYLD